MTLLSQIQTFLHQNPPSGISASYVDRFFERNRPAMEAVLHRFLHPVQQAFLPLPAGVAIRPSQQVRQRPEWVVFYRDEVRGTFNEKRWEDEPVYAWIQGGMAGTSLRYRGLLRFFVPELRAELQPPPRPPNPGRPMAYKGDTTVYLPGVLGMRKVHAKKVTIEEGRDGKLLVEYVAAGRRKAESWEAEGKYRKFLVVLTGEFHEVALHAPADENGLTRHVYGDTSHHEFFRKSLEEWLHWEPSVRVLFDGAAFEADQTYPEEEENRSPAEAMWPNRRTVVPTALNIWVLQEELKHAPQGIIHQVPPTAAPHLRRIIQAGWLEEVPDRKKHWRLSEKGRAGLAANPPRYAVDALPTHPTTDTDLIKACNVVSRRAGDQKGPILGSPPSVDEIQQWLRWNDLDGEWDFLSHVDDEEAMTVLRNCWEADDVEAWLREDEPLGRRVDRLPAQMALRFG